jgi:flavin reductase (DIM6/NTAB) family NADH-FMN oxidoreductase RutF
MHNRYLTGAVVPSAVGLVITESGARRNVMTVSFFSEVAHHPSSLWISIANDSFTHELIRESGKFSLMVLHEKQQQLAMTCGASSGRIKDKCAGLQLRRGPEGFLVIEDCLTSIACRVLSEHVVGDHTVFIAGILAGEYDTKKTLWRHLLTTDLL